MIIASTPWQRDDFSGHMSFLLMLLVGFFVVLIAGALLVFVGAMVVSLARYPRVLRDVNANLLELAALHPDATTLGGIVANGFYRSLRRLRLGSADKARHIAVMVDARGVTVWSLTTPYFRFVTIPVEDIELLKVGRGRSGRAGDLLSVTVRDATRAGELPLLYWRRGQGGATDEGSALMAELLDLNLRHDVKVPVPDGVNLLQATPEEAGRMRAVAAEHLAARD